MAPSSRGEVAVVSPLSDTAVPLLEIQLGGSCRIHGQVLLEPCPCSGPLTCPICASKHPRPAPARAVPA